MARLKRKLKMMAHAIDSRHRALWAYRDFIESLRIDQQLILIESQQGRSVNGNMYYVLKELSSNKLYSSYSLQFVAKADMVEQVSDLLKSRGILNVEVIGLNTLQYVKSLATAHYLITDTSFPPYFIKRSGQVLWNTWHGTPLKTLGRRDKSSLHAIGNVQKNFFVADYLSYPNAYTCEHMVEDYMLQNIAKATILLEGYPRNTAFFDKDRASELRSALEVEALHAYAYMPTWRPPRKGLPKELWGAETLAILLQLDARLGNDEVMFVNLHPLAKGVVDFSLFHHLREFPAEFETYEVLNICDVLVTDYSSVFFDFAVTRKKIVLFDYDRDLYMADRGVYLQLDDLPFPKVKDMESLFCELRSEIDYDDRSFLEKFCPYDGSHAATRLCERVILGHRGDVVEHELQPNGKKNILIYSGNLSHNGITASLTSLLRNLDVDSANYYLTFTSSHVSKFKDYLLSLPEGIAYIPTTGKADFTFQEKAVQYLYARNKISFSRFNEVLSDAYVFDLKRQYGEIKFDTVVQFSGYDYKRIFQFSKFPCRRVIYVHSDMVQESLTRANSRLDLLEYAYGTYDGVGIVSEGLRESVEHISNGLANIFLTPNLFDYNRVREMASRDIEFDDSVESNVSTERLLELLNKTAIVSVGRFSPEKQHKLLLDAFEVIWEHNPEASLVIMGGSSWRQTYDETVEYASGLSCGDSVALIKGSNNPFNIIKKSAGLILPSRYEGFGLVLLEADALGRPVVSTDIAGPRAFMREHGGTLVPNTLEGITAGLAKLSERQIDPMNVDFEQYNNESIRAFYKLIQL